MGKMTKITSMALSTLVVLGSLGAFAGCDVPERNPGGGGEAINTNMSQIYVRNYQGGFGNKWLFNGKDKIEAKYANTSFEDGKTGLQVMITDIKQTPSTTNIPNDIYDVYFVEKVDYLALQKLDVMEEITDIVTGNNPYDNNTKTIESKLTQEQRDFYGIKDGAQTKYYALPHYMAPMGIVYDKDLFDNRNYYFVDGHESIDVLDEKFIVFSDDVKSEGPDGVKGTADDGLPETYEDFWYLCEYIKSEGNMPLNWGGQGSTQFYLTGLLFQLIADYQGKDTFMQNFTMEGVMSDLVKLDNSGNVIYEDGKPATESVTLDPSIENGYETYRHMGYYHALTFLKKMMDTVGTYSIEANIVANSYDAFAAQKDYVESRFESSKKRQAMLIEGSWWDSEASSYFGKYGEESLKENCNYGWLPLPKATREKIGTKNTMVNSINSLCFIKKGVSGWRLDIAKEFVQLMNSDESLVDFTVQTNAFKDFNYDLTPAQVAGLSPFGREMYTHWTKYDVINPNNNNAQYYNSIYTVASSRRYAINGTDLFPAYTFVTKKSTTVDSYFAGTYNYVKSQYWA